MFYEPVVTRTRPVTRTCSPPHICISRPSCRTSYLERDLWMEVFMRSRAPAPGFPASIGCGSAGEVPAFFAGSRNRSAAFLGCARLPLTFSQLRASPARHLRSLPSVAASLAAAVRRSPPPLSEPALTVAPPGPLPDGSVTAVNESGGHDGR